MFLLLLCFGCYPKTHINSMMATKCQRSFKKCLYAKSKMYNVVVWEHLGGHLIYNVVAVEDSPLQVENSFE